MGVCGLPSGSGSLSACAVSRGSGGFSGVVAGDGYYGWLDDSVVYVAVSSADACDGSTASAGASYVLDGSAAYWAEWSVGGADDSDVSSSEY